VILRQYAATSVLALLQEVAHCVDRKIDWEVLVRNTTDEKTDWKALVWNTLTGISGARDYQMLWRYLAVFGSQMGDEQLERTKNNKKERKKL